MSIFAPYHISAEFRDFHDPNHHMAPDELIEWVWSRRSEAVAVPSPRGMVTIKGGAIVATELAHYGNISHSDLRAAALLPLAPEDLHTGIDLAMYAAESANRRTVYAAEYVLKNDKQLAQLVARRDPSQILVRGAMIAYGSHEGETRNDGDSYIKHTLSAAALLGIASRRPKARISPDDMQLLRCMQYGSLNHDGCENQIPDHEDAGRTFLATERQIVSPLVHDAVLRGAGVTHQARARTVGDIVLMTKFVGKDGKISADRYTGQIIVSPTATVDKMADIWDNWKRNPEFPETVWSEADARQLMKWIERAQKYSWQYDTFEKSLHSADPFVRRLGRSIRDVTSTDAFEDYSTSWRILALLEPDLLDLAWKKAKTEITYG